MKRNKHLNIMVCGAAGIGKTSFVHLMLRKFNARKSEDVISNKSKLLFTI